MDESRLVRRVRCRKKGHLLAEVRVTPAGRRIVVAPRQATGDVDPARPGRFKVRHDLGGLVVDLDDQTDPFRTDSRHLACQCGTDFQIFPETLIRGAGDLILDPDSPRG